MSSKADTNQPVSQQKKDVEKAKEPRGQDDAAAMPQQQQQQQQQQRRPQFEYHSSRYEYSSGGDVGRWSGERRDDAAGSGPHWKAVNLDLRPDGRFELNERSGQGRDEEPTQWQRAEGSWDAKRGRVNFKVEKQESKGLEKAITGGAQPERRQLEHRAEGDEAPKSKQTEREPTTALAEQGAAERRRGEHLRGFDPLRVWPIEDEFELALDDLLNTEPFVSPLFRIPMMTRLVPRFLLDEFRG